LKKLLNITTQFKIERGIGDFNYVCGTGSDQLIQKIYKWLNNSDNNIVVDLVSEISCKKKENMWPFYDWSKYKECLEEKNMLWIVLLLCILVNLLTQCMFSFTKIERNGQKMNSKNNKK
jgi:hypothetical protein